MVHRAIITIEIFFVRLAVHGLDKCSESWSGKTGGITLSTGNWGTSMRTHHRILGVLPLVVLTINYRYILQ